VQSKVDKYKTLVKATKAAHRRMDGSEHEVDEEFTDKSKTGDTFKTRTGFAKKTDKGVEHANTSYHDDGEAEEKSGKGIKTHAKAQSAAEKKDRAPAQKQSPKSAKTWGMKDGSKFDNRDKVDEGARGQKNQDSAIKVAQISKSKSPGADLTQSAEDALEKGNHKKIGQIHQYATTTTPTGRAKKVSEAKPSVGLSAAKKSAVVKKAKAGKDIGKPGKGFASLAKKAGGGEKGQKIAAAAMWKNIKETTAYIAEKAKPDFLDMDKDGNKKEPMKKAIADKKKETVKESSDFTRMQEQIARLNRTEKPALVENREVDQIRALTKRLLG
jgi:hypothetical protein